MKETDNKTKSTKASEGFNLKFEDVAIGFRKFGWLCVTLAVVFGALMLGYRHANHVPRYTSEATFTVSTQNNKSSIGGVSVYSFYYNSATANQLAEIFPYILQSDLLHDAIREDLGITYDETGKEIAKEKISEFAVKK